MKFQSKNRLLPTFLLLALSASSKNAESGELLFNGKYQSGQRSLETTFLTTSYDCKLCLDSGLTFCPLSDQKKGYCTDRPEAVRIEICSSDAGNDTNLAYWSCPSEFYCGSSTIITADVNGTLQFIAPNSTTQNLVSGSICKYQIRFPQIGGVNDTITIKVNSMTRAAGYLVAAQTYNINSTVYNASLTTNKVINVTYPNKVFIMVMGNAVFRGDFNISYLFNNMPGPDGNNDQSNSINSNNGKGKSSVSGDSGLSQTNLIIIIVVVGGALIIGLAIFTTVIALRIRKKKLEKIKNLQKKSGNMTFQTDNTPQAGIHYAKQDEQEQYDQMMDVYLKEKFGENYKQYLEQQKNSMQLEKLTQDIDSFGATDIAKSGAEVSSQYENIENNKGFKPSDTIIMNKSLQKAPTMANENYSGYVQVKQQNQVVPSTRLQQQKSLRQQQQESANTQKVTTTAMSMQMLNSYDPQSQNQGLPPINMKSGPLPPIGKPSVVRGHNQFQSDLIIEDADEDDFKFN